MCRFSYIGVACASIKPTNCLNPSQSGLHSGLKESNSNTAGPMEFNDQKTTFEENLAARLRKLLPLHNISRRTDAKVLWLCWNIYLNLFLWGGCGGWWRGTTRMCFSDLLSPDLCLSSVHHLFHPGSWPHPGKSTTKSSPYALEASQGRQQGNQKMRWLTGLRDVNPETIRGNGSSSQLQGRWQKYSEGTVG